MAQVLLISDKTAREEFSKPGDIIGYFDDKHPFSPAEDSFIIKQIEGTPEEVEKELEKQNPYLTMPDADKLEAAKTYPSYPYAVNADKLLDKEIIAAKDIEISCSCNVKPVEVIIPEGLKIDG